MSIPLTLPAKAWYLTHLLVCTPVDGCVSMTVLKNTPMSFEQEQICVQFSTWVAWSALKELYPIAILKESGVEAVCTLQERKEADGN